MKTLLIFFTLLLSVCSYGQIKYPRYEIDSTGKEVVVLTIEQAQKLDNNSELLRLFQIANQKLISKDSLCIKVIDEKETVIALQNLQIEDLKADLSIKDKAIVNLQSTITLQFFKISSFQDELTNKNEEINLHLSKIKESKRKYLIRGLTGGFVVGFVSALLIAL